METKQSKVYQSPTIECVVMDNEISLQLQSGMQTPGDVTQHLQSNKLLMEVQSPFKPDFI